MFIVTKKQIRPNTSVEFFSIKDYPQIQEVFKQYMYQTYMSTGKLLASDETISEDGLTKTVVTWWLDEQSANEWTADPICSANFTNLYKQHCQDNGITISVESRISV
jgi:hypothetical protein